MLFLFRRLAGLIFCYPASFSSTTTTAAAAFACWATTITTTSFRLQTAATQGKQCDKMNDDSREINNNKFRVLLHGGDNMLGRAVQLTFPVQSPDEESIKDSCTAAHYRDMALGHPSSSSSLSSSSCPISRPNLDEIRRQNLHGHGSYLWGDSLMLGLVGNVNVRLLNLETAVTRTIHNKDVPLWKGIRYHTHVDNIPTIMQGLVQATYKVQNGKSCDDDNEISKDNKRGSSPLIVSYANNHCMDYGRRAFEEETLPCLKQCYRDGLFQSVGCGYNLQAASMPAITNDGKFQVFAFSTGCSGTPPGWWATLNQSGLVGLPALIDHESATRALEIIKAVLNAHDGDSHTSSTRPSSSSSSSSSNYNGSGMIRVISIHWGPNWALDGESEQQLAARRELAHKLIDECQVDMIYGHSSHHIRGMEVYNNKLIVYGAGDIVNDYEGFENPGEERYNKLGGIFVIDLDAHTGDFDRLWIVPMFMNRLHLERYQFESELWDPWTRTMHRLPDKSRSLARFVNKLSVADAGSADRALIVEHVDEDSEIPGGPILRSVASS